jgi:hypothetical protein
VGFKINGKATYGIPNMDMLVFVGLEEKFSGKVKKLRLTESFGGPIFHKFTLQRLEKYLSILSVTNRYGVIFFRQFHVCLINLPKL